MEPLRADGVGIQRTSNGHQLLDGYLATDFIAVEQPELRSPLVQHALWAGLQLLGSGREPNDVKGLVGPSLVHVLNLLEASCPRPGKHPEEKGPV
eukprot:5854355-Lingulodinium_polyedra.AAC.1